jgi:hypothetical protein
MCTAAADVDVDAAVAAVDLTIITFVIPSKCCIAFLGFSTGLYSSFSLSSTSALSMIGSLLVAAVQMRMSRDPTLC